MGPEVLGRSSVSLNEKGSHLRSEQETAGFRGPLCAVRGGVQGRGCTYGLGAKVSLGPAFVRPAN